MVYSCAMNTNEISPKTNVRLNRIIKFSKVLRTVFFVGLVVQAASEFGIIVAIPIAALNGLKSQVVFEICSAGVVLLFAFVVTLNFFRFFTRIKDGCLFDSQTVKYLETAGKWWIALGLVQILFQCVEAYFFPPHDITITISANGLLGGVMVFFIAWLFGEAQKLQEEQELTV
jgi:hypothetical protein